MQQVNINSDYFMERIEMQDMLGQDMQGNLMVNPGLSIISNPQIMG
jgi:hypothetical protein